MTKIFTCGFAAATLLIAAPQFAAAQDTDALAGLFACELISETQAQLSCFRTETAKLRGAEASGEIVALEKEAVEEFKELKAEKDIKTAKSRTLTIQSTQRVGPNRYVQFTLDNGEVWQQAETKRVRLGRANPDKLTIKRASFGSFLGKVNDSRSTFRVKRVK
ncbi:hypothetical protein [Litorimonas sp. WD9-15]|uniref:hypothetical protein n=1 Tax=Litorimonas sp. WD9-15 TaxID=3418716 RepID=UPI003D08180A